MGMISFLKEAGEKLFGKSPEVAAVIAEPTNEEKVAAANAAASSAIKDYIRTQKLPADDLTISFNGAFFGLTQGALGKASSFWPVAWLVLCAAVAIAWLAAHSRFGQILRATQANEERMRFSGFDTYKPRLAAFVVASFIVSLAGVAMALNSAFASPEALDFATGGHSLVAMLIGGAATVGGPLFGALLYTWGQDAFGATGYLELLTGIAVVVMISAFPKGAMGFVIEVWRRLRAGGRGGA